MKTYYNVSTYVVSWVKSNKRILEESGGRIQNLYYPESVEEVIDLLKRFTKNNEEYDIIGYSSNTLFLPSYSIRNMICTKNVNSYTETEDEIICECGVNVSLLAKKLIKKGYVGFEGLTDLPGTVGGAVYGNAGCRNCSINSLLNYILLLTPQGKICKLTLDDLNLQYRSSALKRNEIKGVILKVSLKKNIGDSQLLQRIASDNHQIRLAQQPSPSNNLGTTFIGNHFTQKGRLIHRVEKVVQFFMHTKDSRKSIPIVLWLIGKKRFSPYVYYWNRYLFLDEKANVLFSSYMNFIKSLYEDLQLEIEIRR